MKSVQHVDTLLPEERECLLDWVQWVVIDENQREEGSMLHLEGGYRTISAAERASKSKN
jgi:hypothetical protein